MIDPATEAGSVPEACRHDVEAMMFVAARR
jgi:hypothetical protein